MSSKSMGVFEIFGSFVIALYAIWVVYLVMQWRTARKSEESEEMLTSIAIVIAFRNEADHLQKLLPIITRELQHTPHVELILVDDGSEDDSLAIAKRHSSDRVRIISNGVKPGKKGAIHAGIMSTQAEWIHTLDADAQPGREWLVQSARHIEAHQAADLLIFPVWMEDQRNFLTRLQEMEWLSILGVTGGMALGGQPIL
ncbi:MAG: glycosyltransferase, partial [Flavobacteriales bacterium]